MYLSGAVGNEPYYQDYFCVFYVTPFLSVGVPESGAPLYRGGEVMGSLLAHLCG